MSSRSWLRRHRLHLVSSLHRLWWYQTLSWGHVGCTGSVSGCGFEGLLFSFLPGVDPEAAAVGLADSLPRGPGGCKFCASDSFSGVCPPDVSMQDIMYCKQL